jgi:hypothetical protein
VTIDHAEKVWIHLEGGVVHVYPMLQSDDAIFCCFFYFCVCLFYAIKLVAARLAQSPITLKP